MLNATAALTLSVWQAENASLATLQAAVQTFLQGAGTPALTDSARVHEVVIRSGGAGFYAYVVYTE